MDDNIPCDLHYTELPPASECDALATEWETYRREIGRLLAEGHEGKCAIIRGNRIVGIYSTEAEASEIAYKTIYPQTFMLRPIRSREPYVRLPRRVPWPLLSQLR